MDTTTLEAILTNIQAEKSYNKRFKINIEYSQFVDLMSKSANMILQKRNESRLFEIDENVDEVLKYLFNWLICDNSVNYNRGILISGSYGCGKTLILTAFYQVFLQIAKKTGLLTLPNYFRSNQIIEYINVNGHNDVITKFPLFIDELGREQLQQKNYGNIETPVIEMFLQRWENGTLTFATSNIKLSTLASDEKYGKMVGDRLPMIFNYIEMKGNSKRK